MPFGQGGHNRESKEEDDSLGYPCFPSYPSFLSFLGARKQTRIKPLPEKYTNDTNGQKEQEEQSLVSQLTR